MNIKKIRHLKQEKGMCGPVCLKIILHYYGKEVSLKKLKKMLRTKRLFGTSNQDMIRVAKKLGFKATYKKNSSLQEIKKLIKQNTPPLIGWINFDEASHYSIIKRIDKKKVYLLDPEITKTRTISIKEFEERWMDADWEHMSTTKKIMIGIQLLLTKKQKEKILPLKEKDISKRELIIIKP